MLEAGVLLSKVVDAVVLGSLESGQVIGADVYPPRVGVPDGRFEVGFVKRFWHIEYFTVVFRAGLKFLLIAFHAPIFPWSQVSFSNIFSRWTTAFSFLSGLP